jgi:hypothetical protein
MKRILALMSLALVLATVWSGCAEKSTSPRTAENQPPALPPAESMKFDFSFFESQGAANPQSETEAVGHDHWLNAVVRVFAINLFISDAFAPPFLAFQAAIHTTPVLQDDGSYLWTYVWNDPSSDPAGRQITIRLRGRIEGVRVHWQLHVDDPGANPPLVDFLWFSGESGIVSNEGFWLFNDIQDGHEVANARIDWRVQAPRDRFLAFECTREGSEGYGDRLTYQVGGPVVTILFHDASADTDADIMWNETTGAGSLQVPDYNEGARACWDSQRNDVDCGPAL